jgi:hypothetical protein
VNHGHSLPGAAAHKRISKLELASAPKSMLYLIARENEMGAIELYCWKIISHLADRHGDIEFCDGAAIWQDV